jgi:hypothetical protein
MATGGVSIASAVVEEEGTSAFAETADAVMQPIAVVTQRIVDVGKRRRVATAPTLQQPVAAHLTVPPMPQRRVAGPLTAADRMVAASATSP